MPRLSDREAERIAASGSLSDSFYFIGQQLIMHNKAHYHYAQQDEAKAH